MLKKPPLNAKLNIAGSLCPNLHRPQKSQSLPEYLLQNQRVKRLQKNAMGLELKNISHFRATNKIVKVTSLVQMFACCEQCSYKPAVKPENVIGGID